MKSVGQKAAKLLAVKIWEWFDPRRSRIQAEWFERGQGRAADFFVRPPTLIASNFDGLWPTDPIFLAEKELIPFPKYSKI